MPIEEPPIELPTKKDSADLVALFCLVMACPEKDQYNSGQNYMMNLEPLRHSISNIFLF